MKNKTMVYLNTWQAYNNGCIGFGWMDASEAKNFIEENPERAGGEWFIADIDNYLGVDFGNLDYCDVLKVLDTIETLEDMDEYDLERLVALMEYECTRDIDRLLDSLDDYIFYSSIDEYYDFCDELIEMSMNQKGVDELLTRYFDYEAYHRDCNFDVYEAGNGIVIAR